MSVASPYSFSYSCPLTLTSTLAASLVAAILFGAAVSAVADESFEIVFKQGRIVDGQGGKSFVADVGIRGGKIAAIGELGDGQRTIDARGLVVAPGFVDMMGQSATSLLENPASAANLLSQGVTTINCGEGVSEAPLTDERAARTNWRTMAEYFQLLDMRGLPVNVTQTVGHTQTRLVVLGDVDRRPSEQELARMQELVREGMEAGAIGVSTSLIYPPAVYADTAEVAALAKVAGQYGGRYYTHMRNEGDRLLEAIDEALEIGRLGGTPVHIFHLKAAGRHNWDKMAHAIERIKVARSAGQHVAADVYPYVNNGLGIAALINPRHFAQGEANFLEKLKQPELRARIRREMEEETGWENWYRHVGRDWNKIIVGAVASEKYSPHSGKSLAEVAKACDEDPWETFFNLVAARAFALPESMSDDNVRLGMRQDFVSFCTDVGPAAGTRIASHPRAFGAFPRLLARYVRDGGVLSLEQAVAQASRVACQEVMARDRGRLEVGLAADVIAFDLDKVADRATFAEPHAQAEGMRYVVVNGRLVWDDGKQTNQRPGRVLRGPGFRPSPRPGQSGQSGQSDKSGQSGKTSPLDPAKAPAAEHPTVVTLDEFFGRFLDEHRVPGCAVAVTRDRRLVYARGFGWADIAERTPVTPRSLFRIASISKPVTAVAIMKLVEQGKLKLDDRMLDRLPEELLAAVPGNAAGKATGKADSSGGGGTDADRADDVDKEFDERQRAITLRHLLHHRGGWDRDKSFDAMFQPVRFAEQLGRTPPAGPHDVIRCMFRVPLDFDPGKRFAYSNYGYCLLGRVIERATGKAYDEYVKQEVLAPAGIRSMRIGATLPTGRTEGEVRYYDPAMGNCVFADQLGRPVPHPYGAWYLEAMDAHGGWIASAIDLVRFAVALDPDSPRPLLKADTLRAMTSPPTDAPELDDQGQPKPTYYALGWNVRPIRSSDESNRRQISWHTGSLPGTSTILIRRHDGLNIAVLFNSRVSPTVEHLTRALEGPLHERLGQIADWPEGDLFEAYSDSPD